MPTTYPYVTSSGPLLEVFAYLRTAFPPLVSTAALQQLGLAPKNESYIVNILRFIGVIDTAGAGGEGNAALFTCRNDAAFAAGMEKLVRQAYMPLFDLHADKAWALDTGSLTEFFRQEDRSSPTVGRRQATTFHALAYLAGHGGSAIDMTSTILQEARTVDDLRPGTSQVLSSSSKRRDDVIPGPTLIRESREGPRTIRIEIHLPTADDQSVYDKIFRSMRENLLKP